MAMWSSASRPSKTTSTAIPAWRRPVATVIASFAWSSTTSRLTSGSWITTLQSETRMPKYVMAACGHFWNRSAISFSC